MRSDCRNDDIPTWKRGRPFIEAHILPSRGGYKGKGQRAQGAAGSEMSQCFLELLISRCGSISSWNYFGALSYGRHFRSPRLARTLCVDVFPFRSYLGDRVKFRMMELVGKFLAVQFEQRRKVTGTRAAHAVDVSAFVGNSSLHRGLVISSSCSPGRTVRGKEGKR